MKPVMPRASIVAVFAVMGIGLAPLAMAQEEDKPPQVVRQELMKENGEAVGVMGKMVKGETEYDAQAVLDALAVIEANAAEFPEHFPEGSETGHETEALPAIWENKEDFESRAMALSEDAATIIAAAPADLETFQPMFEDLTSNCGGCHEKYREKQD